MTVELQNNLKAAYSTVSRDLNSYTSLKNAVVNYYSQSTPPTTSQTIAMLNIVLESARNLSSAQSNIRDEMDKLISLIELSLSGAQTGLDSLPSTGNTEYGFVTFNTIIADLVLGLNAANSSSTASSIANIIVNKINAFNPKLTAASLTLDLSATMAKNSISAQTLAGQIVTSLNNLGNIANNANDGASSIEAAIYGNVFNNNQVALLNDISNAEQLHDLMVLKNGLVAAFGGGSVYSGSVTDLATAVLAVFTNAGLGSTSLTLSALEKDLNNTLSMDGAPALGILAQNIANDLIALANESLTASLITNAVYGSVDTSDIVQADSIKADVINAEALMDYVGLKTILLHNLGNITNVSSATNIADAILDAYSHSPYSGLNLSATELTNSIQASLTDLHLDPISLVGYMITALNALDGTSGHEVNANHLMQAIFNANLYTVSMDHLYQDINAAEEYQNYAAVKAAMISNLSGSISRASDVVNALLDAYSGGSTLTSGQLTNDVGYTLAANSYGPSDLATALIAQLNDVSTTNTAAGIETALYKVLGFYEEGLLKTDLTTVEALIDVVTYKTSLINAIEGTALYTNNSGNGFSNNAAVTAAIADFATAVHSALSASYTQTLTAAEIQNSFTAAYFAKIGNANYNNTVVMYGIHAYQAFAIGLVTNLQALADNTLTVAKINNALFGTMNMFSKDSTQVGNFYLIEPDAYNLNSDISATESFINLNAFRNAITSGIHNATTASAIATAINNAFKNALGLGGADIHVSQPQLEQDVIAGLTALYGANYTTDNVTNFANNILTVNLNAINANALTAANIDSALFGTGLIIEADQTQVNTDIQAVSSLINSLSMRDALVTALTPVAANNGATAANIVTAIESVTGSANLSNALLLQDVSASISPNTSKTAQVLAEDLIIGLQALDDDSLTPTIIANAMYGSIAAVDAHNFITDANNAETYSTLVAIKNALVTNINAIINLYGANLGENALANAILTAVNLTPTHFSLSDSQLVALRNDIFNSEGTVPTAPTIAASIVSALNAFNGILTTTSIINCIYGASNSGLITATTSEGSSNDAVTGTVYGDMNVVIASNSAYGPYSQSGTVMANLYNALHNVTFNSASDLATAITSAMNTGSNAQLVTALDLTNDIAATMSAHTQTAQQVAGAILTALVSGPYHASNTASAVKSIIYGTNDTGDLAQDGPVIEAPTTLITSANPIDLEQDATNAEALRNFIAIKNAVMTGLDSWDPELNANALGNHIIAGINVLGSSVTLANLVHDIQASINSGDVTETALALAVHNALNALNNRNLTAANIGNAIYGAGLITDTHSGADTTALISAVTTAEQAFNGFGPYTYGGSVTMPASIMNELYTILGGGDIYSHAKTVTDLAHDIVYALDLISLDGPISSPKLTQAELLSDIMFTLDTNRPDSNAGVSVLAGNIKAALITADSSANGIMTSIYGGAGLVQLANADAALLAEDITANQASDQYAVIQAHLSNALSTFTGTTADDLSDVILSALRYINTHNNIPNTNPDSIAWTPALQTSMLSGVSFTNDIIASLPFTYTPSDVQALAARINTAVLALGTVNSTTLAGAIFANNLIQLGDADATSFQNDIVYGVANYNGFTTITTQLQTALGNLSAGATDEDLASAIIGAIDQISSSTYNLASPLLTSARLEADIDASIGGLITPGTLGHAINTALTGANSASSIVAAIYNPSRIIAASTDHDALLNDLNAAVAVTHSFNTIATKLYNALGGTSPNTYGSANDLATSMTGGLMQLADSTSITPSLSRDALEAAITAGAAYAGGFTSLGVAVKTEIAGLIENSGHTPITAVSLADAIYGHGGGAGGLVGNGSSGLTSPNPASLATDLESYAAMTDMFNIVAGNIKTGLLAASTDIASSDAVIAHDVISTGLARVGSVVTQTSDLTSDLAGSYTHTNIASSQGFAGTLANHFATLPTTAAGIIADLYGSDANHIVSADLANLTADLQSYQTNANSYSNIAGNLVIALGGVHDYTGSTATDLATAIVNGITTNPTARTNLALDIITLAGDISVSLSGIGSVASQIATLAAAIKTAVTGATTAQNIQDAIYNNARVLATGSDEASLLADISATQTHMTSGGSEFTTMGTALYTALHTYAAGHGDAATESTALATVIYNIINTISMGHEKTGGLTIANLALDIAGSLSGSGSVSSQIATLTGALSSSLADFSGNTAALVENALYNTGLIVVANPANMIADIAAAEGYDNQITLSSITGSNSIAAAASAGSLDNTVTGWIGNHPTCTSGHTHNFQSCSYIDGTLVHDGVINVTYDCTASGATSFIESCSAWSKKPGLDGYASYNGGECLVSFLGARAYEACVDGMNHHTPVC